MKLSLWLAACAALAAAAPSAHALDYQFTTINPNVPFVQLTPFGINEAGQVSGVYTDAARADHGFILSGGQGGNPVSSACVTPGNPSADQPGRVSYGAFFGPMRRFLITGLNQQYRTLFRVPA